MADDEARGFLGRWARRKTDAAQGKPLVEPVPPEVVIAAKAAMPDTNTQPPAVGAGAPAVNPAQSHENEPPPLTLDDVKLLTKDSDFKPFMAGHIGPEVRNAAMKKLFADPQFNIMDGLDIYIDDYSKSDPIPEAMLRQMSSAKVFKLFDDEEEADGQKSRTTESPWENENDPTGQSMAQSYEKADISQPVLPSPDNTSQPEPTNGSGASQEDHADTDLRLQPNHAAPAPDGGHGTQ